jgi:hypothetical protein
MGLCACSVHCSLSLTPGFFDTDPQGDFVEALGRQHTPEQAANMIEQHVKDWKGDLKRGIVSC